MELGWTGFRAMKDTMAKEHPSKTDVVLATADDLSFILTWLKEEHDANNEGFWVNRNVISRAFEEGDLYVVRLNGEAVAYQVGHYSPDITNVRQNLQRRGYGAALFEAGVDRAYGDGVNVLSGQCAPETSLPFWLKHGFEQYEDRYRRGDILVRRLLHRTYDLPDHLPRVRVAVRFYPEGALYGDENAVPIATYNMKGAVQPDGLIQLNRRALAAASQEPDGQDLVVRVEVDGVTRCFGEAKHPEQVSAGVARGERDGSFYIDLILVVPH